MPKTTDLLTFILGKHAVYVDGVLYYNAALRFNLAGTPNTYTLDMKKSEVIFSRWNTRTRYADQSYPMNQVVVADGDVAVIEGFSVISPATKLRLTVTHYQTTLKAYQLGRRIKMGIIDNKIVADNQGLRRPGGSGEDQWKKRPSIIEVEDVPGMAVIQYFNEDHKSTVLDYNSVVWVRGKHVLYTTEAGSLPFRQV